ncbi:MAG: DUF3667 domain-containing protein [Sphingobacteriales bacterium]|nr:MAG: DUF3667 domain-containing protein [Sphingobacteriales bacterium]
MSHLHQRKEKNCLNCGAQLVGHFCQDCGQENLEPKESFGHLLRHFLEDLTHFDGKLFATMRPLLFKPGFLTKEYVAGRRVAYLNPIRMYLFISAMFFLIMATFFLKGKHEDEKAKKTHKEVGVARKSFSNLANTLEAIDTAGGADTNQEYITLKNGDRIIADHNPKTIESYDSLQALMYDKDKHGMVQRFFTRKTIRTMQYDNEHPGETQHVIKEKFWHSFPYMLFFTLPLLALLLKLLYVRRKEFYYVSHIIFIIHFYCFIFLLLLVSFTISECGHWGNIIGNVLILGSLVYLHLGMRRFYGQGTGKTIIKFLLLLVFGLGSISILTLGLAINAFLNVGG